MVNSADQTAPYRSSFSWSALFALACLGIRHVEGFICQGKKFSRSGKYRKF